MGHLFLLLYSVYLLSTLHLGCIAFLALHVQTGEGGGGFLPRPVELEAKQEVTRDKVIYLATSFF